ncbi:DNA-binding transcriptional regulator GbsR (MarR family) [Pullulanibacillus pueri]|uniref:Uncharacterized protein n=1 Tax=Pullulanibacillus pueri TaxID=1437324 RepID=A0A8J2ZWI2_9BACL|nr:DNA-binding transcriptional regulator GbsR (MarR family) [Pullulanibacillus pueri]GGH83238.1 hypothetical protein GCM10007096_23810 [Pullulanibacillus pueri]
MVKYQLKCVWYFQEAPFDFLCLEDLGQKLELCDQELQACIQHLVKLSILKQITIQGIRKYYYNCPNDVLIQGSY